MTAKIAAPNPVTRFGDLLYAHIGELLRDEPECRAEDLVEIQTVAEAATDRSSTITDAMAQASEAVRDAEAAFIELELIGPNAGPTPPRGSGDWLHFVANSIAAGIVVRDRLPAGLFGRAWKSFSRFLPEDELDGPRYGPMTPAVSSFLNLLGDLDPTAIVAALDPSTMPAVDTAPMATVLAQPFAGGLVDVARSLGRSVAYSSAWHMGIALGDIWFREAARATVALPRAGLFARLTGAASRAEIAAASEGYRRRILVRAAVGRAAAALVVADTADNWRTDFGRFERFCDPVALGVPTTDASQAGFG
ncbi:MAG: hypothetical protein V4515_07900 [Chloroflexota bacterium]